MTSFLEDLPGFAPPLGEAWSEKARAAALLARREHLGTRVNTALGVHAPITDQLAAERRATELKLAHGVGRLRHGESISVKLPEGQITATRTRLHAGGPIGRSAGYHVDGGGQAVDASLRRGPRNLVGRGNVEREILERQRSAHEAEIQHTTTHALAAHEAKVGEKVRVQAVTGHSATVTKQHDGTFKVQHETEDLPSTTQKSAAEAVHSLKTVLRDKKQARFLDEGHDTDPLSTMASSHILRNGVVVGLHRQIPEGSEHVDKANPTGAVGDIAPDVVQAATHGNPLSRGPLVPAPSEGGIASATPQGAISSIAQHVSHIFHHAASQPAVHHAVTHVHLVHHMLQSVEFAEGELKEALDDEDRDRARRARYRLFDARVVLREELADLGLSEGARGHRRKRPRGK